MPAWWPYHVFIGSTVTFLLGIPFKSRQTTTAASAE
jgi:hypothetical protein